jgi:amidophosphoribosyltransferase
MVRSAGAKEVHLRISCPPTISPCFYGVDTPTKGELIAANSTLEDIRKFTEADSLDYLPLSALSEAVQDDERNFCYACYTGNYPTHFINLEELVNAPRKGK